MLKTSRLSGAAARELSGLRLRRRESGTRSYNWVRTKLQEHGAVERGKGKVTHRRRREPAPWPGMMLHRDGSTHEWVHGAGGGLGVRCDARAGGRLGGPCRRAFPLRRCGHSAPLGDGGKGRNPDRETRHVYLLPTVLWWSVDSKPRIDRELNSIY